MFVRKWEEYAMALELQHATGAGVGRDLTAAERQTLSDEQRQRLQDLERDATH